MTRRVIRSLALLGLGLSLTACTGYQPLEANCFSFRDALAAAAPTLTTISTMGAEVTRRDTACDFVLLGAGG